VHELTPDPAPACTRNFALSESARKTSLCKAKDMNMHASLYACMRAMDLDDMIGKEHRGQCQNCISTPIDHREKKSLVVSIDLHPGTASSGGKSTKVVM
jgi:hypothetical protein